MLTEEHLSILIHGGRLIDPSRGIDDLYDLRLEGGIVQAVERPGILQPQAGDTVIDAAGCIVAPGLIDLHVHLREPGQTWKESIATGTSAAAAGGYTTVVAMPNTVPVNDSVETFAWMLSPERGPHVRLLAMPAVTVGSMGRKLVDFEALAHSGAVGFTDDGRPVLDERLMREALLLAGRLGLVISQHAEDTRISPSSGINDGAVAFRLGLRGMSIEAEAAIVERDIALVADILRVEGVRARLHVQHVSTARAIEAVRRAKAGGLSVSCEATPHHFTLTDTALLEGPHHFDTNCKMNPPLRSEADRQAVITGLLDGTIDCIATDHAPHARYEKEIEFERAPNGLTGLETALGLALRVLQCEHGASLAHVVKLMSTTPAQLIGQPTGTLRPGSPADVTILNAETDWRFRSATSRSKSHNTPFDGAAMLGAVTATIVGGRIAYAQRTTA
jgi:dihydroorotase